MTTWRRSCRENGFGRLHLGMMIAERGGFECDRSQPPPPEEDPAPVIEGARGLECQLPKLNAPAQVRDASEAPESDDSRGIGTMEP